MSFSRLSPRIACAALVAAGASGCGLDVPPDDAAVVVSMLNVPVEVQCVRITAAGAARTLVKSVDVAGGQSFTEALTGVPLGPVALHGEAFALPCPEVKKSSIAGWVSAPVNVTIAPGRQTSATLTMHRNGRVKVGVEFPDEPAGDSFSSVDAEASPGPAPVDPR